MTTTIVRGIGDYRPPSDRPTVVTVGTFDGIHLGHQEILRRVQDTARKLDYDPVLVTFHPHPRVVVTPGDAPLLLTTIEEKERFVQDFFEGTVLVLEFNRPLMNMSAEQYVRDILLSRLGMKKLVVGYDHAFGKNRSGTIVELKRLGESLAFDVEVIGPVTVADRRVSSSAIRRALRQGDFTTALTMLGHPYAIHGVVEKGIGLGRKLGYPTANIRHNSRKLLPAHGVYACRAHLGRARYEGMMFIGTNHFNPEQRTSVEANLFDFEGDLYGREILVCPTRFIRENRRFESADRLVDQIKRDKMEVLRTYGLEKGNANAQGKESRDYC